MGRLELSKFADGCGEHILHQLMDKTAQDGNTCSDHTTIHLHWLVPDILWVDCRNFEHWRCAVSLTFFERVNEVWICLPFRGEIFHLEDLTDESEIVCPIVGR